VSAYTAKHQRRTGRGDTGRKIMSASSIKEMMDNWAKTEADARAANPDASDEQIYQMTADAMSKSLGL
jgi:hypothetical protein